MNIRILFSFIFLLLVSCNNTANQQQNNASGYFNVKGYFEQEIIRLTKTNPTVTKTVVVNDATETKKIKIADWKKELSIFSDADINRASWKGLFSVSKSTEKEIYRSDNEKIPVKEVQIIYKGSRLKEIHLVINNLNTLYRSTDSLSYYPDSLYQVKKDQDIKLLSKKQYKITGKF